MSGNYANIYGRAREALESEAEQRLGRALTQRERNLFRNCGTLTMLESLGMKVYFAENARELETHLAQTSMDSRFSLAVDELVMRLERFLGNPLTAEARTSLRRMNNIEELWAFEQAIQRASPTERPQVFTRLVQRT